MTIPSLLALIQFSFVAIFPALLFIIFFWQYVLHYFLLILLNLLNNVILYQLWWDAKCLYEVQIPKCD